jgi:protein required for attachment to host cells
MPTTTWIVAADASRARFLQVAGQDKRFTQFEDLLNPAGRAEDKELTTDATPRFSGHGGVGKPGARSTSGPGSDREEPSAQEHETELFAKRIGDYLDQARNQHRYDELYLVAPPKFLGMLRKKLNKEVQKLVVDEFDKDLSWFNPRELESRLKAAVKGSAPGP